MAYNFIGLIFVVLGILFFIFRKSWVKGALGLYKKIILQKDFNKVLEIMAIIIGGILFVVGMKMFLG